MDSLSQVTALFALIDKDVSEFRLKTGLRCPPDCGTCCHGANVQATVLEMLPVAHEIFRRGMTSFYEALLEDRTDAGLCAFFMTDSPMHTAGHCCFYDLRPAVCRLFGYAGVRTRLGAIALAACKTMKQSNPAGVTAAIEQQSEAPCLSGYGTRVCAIDPALGTHPMPVNNALRRAIERVGLHIRLAHQEDLGSITPRPDSDAF